MRSVQRALDAAAVGVFAAALVTLAAGTAWTYVLAIVGLVLVVLAVARRMRRGPA